MFLERRRIKPHYIAVAACGLDALGVLSVTGYCSDGVLPVWLYAVLMPLLLGIGVILYQLAMRLYLDERRRQRRPARNMRLDAVRMERRNGTE